MCLLVVQAVFVTLFRGELRVVVFISQRIAKILKDMHIGATIVFQLLLQILQCPMDFVCCKLIQCHMSVIYRQ